MILIRILLIFNLLKFVGSNFLKGSREFYQSISLCRGEHAVDRVHFFPLRFTPDGSKLIAIAQNFHEIYIFPYFGVQFGANCTRNELFNVNFVCLYNYFKSIYYLVNFSQAYCSSIN